MTSGTKAWNAHRLLLIALTAVSVGCQQQGPIVALHEASGAEEIEQTRVLLASDGATPVRAPRLREIGTTKPAESQPTTETASTQPTRRGYTAPGAAVRQASLLPAAMIAASVGSVPSAGREASEASVSTGSAGGRGVLGAAGLTAPQAATLNAVVGQPGLVRGYPIGLGPAPRLNLLTRDIRPLTGPTGLCNDLVRAGFFANPAACADFFRRR